MASKIFITGDTHGKIDIEKIYNRSFKAAKLLTKDDILIIAGDAGIIWDGFTRKNNIANRDRRIIDIYERRPFTTAFVDGNHENHQAISKYPIEDWNGGKIHRISPSVIHLMRGECYTINNKKFFIMGGADSIDKIWRQTQFMMTGDVSWWPEEMPSNEEYEHAKATIAKNNNQFDYIITHCASTDIQKRLHPEYRKDDLTDFFNIIENEVTFKQWFFGHYHEDINVDNQHTCIYKKIIQVI